MKKNIKIIIVTTIFLAAGWLSFGFAQEAGEGQVPHFAAAGPGVINLPLEASPFSGEAATSVAIQLLPSSGDIQEKIDLTLQYRSGAGNSWLGKGWELEPGYIARINKFGANNPNNPYLLVLNGGAQELVSIGGSQYRTKMESNMRIEFNGSAWQVWEKDGTLYKFETFAAARWVLTRVTNTHGISLVLDYDQPGNGEIYLSQIRYPEGSALSAYCTVSFISEDRQDKLISYYYGSAFKLNRRLKEIRVLAEGRAQKRYVLNYTTNGTSQTSLLSSVTEYGKDGSAMPAITFSYQQPLQSNILGGQQEWLVDTNNFYTHQIKYDTECGAIPAGIDTAIIDLNGDNLPDLLGCKFLEPSRNNDSQSKWVAHLNTGNGFSGQEDTWAELDNAEREGSVTRYPAPITLTRNSTLVDMNKDSLPDLVYSRYGGKVGDPSTKAYSIYVRYNMGNKFSDTETKLLDYTQAYYTFTGSVGNATGVIKIGEGATLMDINGDGLPDLVYHRKRQWEKWGIYDYGGILISYFTFDLAARLNTGNSFSSEEKIWLDKDKTYYKYSYERGSDRAKHYDVEFIGLYKNAAFVDMNNDGLPDLVYNDYAEVKVKRYSESVDYAPSYNWKVRLNTGEKFSDETLTYLGSAPAYIYMIHTPPRNFTKTSSVRAGENGILTDINNDGLPDLVFNKFESGDLDNRNWYIIKTDWMVCFNLGNKFANPVTLFNSINYDYDYYYKGVRHANAVTTNSYLIDIDKDGVSDLVYPQFTKWDPPVNGQTGKASFALKVHINNGPLPVDLLTSQTASFGGRTDITYTSSGDFDNTAGDGRNDLPFIMTMVETTTKNPGIGEAGTTSYVYAGGWYDIPKREFRGFRQVQATDPLGYITQLYFLQNDAKLGKLQRQVNSITETQNTYRDDDTAPYFTPLIQTEEYMNSKCKRVHYEYDDYGNINKTSYSGDISISGDEKCVLADYALNPSSWLVNLAGRERIFANAEGTGSPAAETQYFYDNNTNYTDAPAKGDLTKVKRYLDTSLDYIQASSTYDSYGNEVTKTDANGNTTQIEYDSSYHSFPVTVTNPKGHIERLSYYLPSDTKGLFGQVKSKTDPNANETAFEYDGFGRKTRVIGPYDLSSTYGSESYEYGIGGPGANYILTRTTEENGASSCFMKVDILDGFEKVIQSAKESENESIYSYVTTSYNGRGESAKTSLPYFADSGLRTTYLGPDAAVKWTQYAYDALGRITAITKPDGGVIQNTYSDWSTVVTDENNHQKTFTRDAYERLSSVKELNKGEQYGTDYYYDALDNLTRIRDHLGNNFTFDYDSLQRRTAMDDPDLGAWTYEYDNNGNLTKTTNAKGEAISFTYDTLNRPLTKNYANYLGTEVTYSYDEPSSTNSIGRRTSMQDTSGASRWDFDKEGRVAKLEKQIDDNTYRLAWTYDAMDRIKTILLPNLKNVSYRYNNAGLAEGIDGFVANTDYNAAYQPLTITFSNPMTTSFDYYPQNLRLKSILTGSLQDLNYEYDLVGNISKITDRARSLVKDYLYDDLDRLLFGDGNTYGYNAIGNLTNVNGLAQSYASVHIHALTSDGTNNYAYDACGNMLSGAARSIIYDPENRPVTITKGDLTTQFFYDGDGKRVKKTVADSASTTTTIYIEDLYEKETTQGTASEF